MPPTVLLAFLAAGVGLRTVEVDAARTIGTLRSFQGVCDGPLPLRPGTGVDLTTQYKALRIDFIRAHDLFGPVDIEARWTNPPRGLPISADASSLTVFPNWSADPERPESYNFGPTDRFVAGVVGSGAQLCYRIGRSFGADGTPPADFDKYANIVRHVAMHYNAGWANGFHDNIRYWEVWNEPNAQGSWNPGAITPFWSGTPQQYYTLYQKVAAALKSFDPTLKVGAPALAVPDMPGPYREGFMSYCAAHRLPLDFFSWHHYHGGSFDPYDMVRIGQVMRQLLDTNGFRNTEMLVTEWNTAPGRAAREQVNQSPMDAAAFLGNVLTYLQDSAVNRATYYRADAGPHRLFTTDGSYSLNAYVFWAAGQMLDTPERLPVAGADTMGFSVLAGRSADRGKVRLLISNYEIPPEYRASRPGGRRMSRQAGINYGNNRGYALRIANLPWGSAAFTAKRYHLSESGTFNVQNLPAGHGPAFELHQELPPPGVDFIVFERQ